MYPFNAFDLLTMHDKNAVQHSSKVIKDYCVSIYSYCHYDYDKEKMVYHDFYFIIEDAQQKVVYKASPLSQQACKQLYSVCTSTKIIHFILL